MWLDKGRKLPAGLFLVVLVATLGPSPAAAATNITDATQEASTVMPPATVIDLQTISRTTTTITLQWTSPGAHGMEGTASQYDIRYATFPIDSEAAWQAAAMVPAPPTPQPPGSTETFTVTGLSPGTRYYFALKTANPDGFWSGLSNSPLGITASRPPPPPPEPPAEAPPLAGQTSLWRRVDPDGVMTRQVICESFDGLLTLTLNVGNRALTRYGSPLRWIGMFYLKEAPSPPRGAFLISYVYDLQPDGATFDRPKTVAYSYDPGHIPLHLDEQDLVIAQYDTGTGEWILLETEVDTEARIVTARISHFSALAVFAYDDSLPPAIFEFSALSILPPEVYTGERVTISILAANVGEEPGSVTVDFKINDHLEASEEVALAAGTSRPVSLTTVRDRPGTYRLEAAGLTGSFSVKEKVVPPEPPEPPPPPEEPLPSVGIIGYLADYSALLGAIGGVVLGALVVLLVVRRKRPGP